jgi:hypothetical protein
VHLAWPSSMLTSATFTEPVALLAADRDRLA